MPFQADTNLVPGNPLRCGRASMSVPGRHRPVLCVLAVFSRYAAALQWARRHAEQHWGTVVLASPEFAFDQTDYYRQSMGPDLIKVLWAFEALIEPPCLVDRKLQTIGWEAAYKEASNWPELRPLNLDPGYVTEAKLVLATTKDRDHRLYLGQGIYGEITLYYRHGQWRAREWTYRDFQSAGYHAFLSQCRNYLRQRYRAKPRA
jgi:hypothetical protein